jgi:hypothetical protein
MRKLIAAIGTLATPAAVLVATSTPAEADPECIKWSDETGACILYVESDDDDNGTVDPVSNDDSTGGETVECTDGGQVVPCTWDGGIWSSENGCYITPAAADIPPGSPLWEGHTDGAVYPCYNPRTFYNTFVWLADPPTGGPAPPDPEDLAEQALALMNLHMFELGITPKPGPQYMGYVGLPTWLWVADQSPNTWGPISRSVSAGGITVTATAKVDRVVWEMGDGQTVTCDSAGTPYRPAYGDSDSPDCGYRYTRSSADQPHNAYTVTATAYWVVNWSGAGASGQIPLDFTDSAQIRIGEAQALGQ